MTHYTNADFWYCYRHLPNDVQKRADKAYELLRQNPRHPSLHFKKVGGLWSVRVTLNYRAKVTNFALQVTTNLMQQANMQQ